MTQKQDNIGWHKKRVKQECISLASPSFIRSSSLVLLLENSFDGSLFSCRRIMPATSKHAYLWSHSASFDHLVLVVKYQPIPSMTSCSCISFIYLMSEISNSVCIFWHQQCLFLSSCIHQRVWLHCFEKGLPTFASTWTFLQQGNWFGN